MARRSAAEAERERGIAANSRLEGAVVTIREIAHRGNSHLAGAYLALDLLEIDKSDRMPIETMREVIERIANDIQQLQHVVRVVTRETPVGPALDLGPSTSPYDSESEVLPH